MILIVCSISISTLLIGLSVGFLVGHRVVSQTFKRELENPDSEISRRLAHAIAEMGTMVTEAAAKGAEMYQDSCRCINSCGTQIAKMIRDTQKLRSGSP